MYVREVKSAYNFNHKTLKGENPSKRVPLYFIQFLHSTMTA